MIDYDYAEEQEDGSVRYYATYWVGGRDDNGEYERVLDGPAEGERVYL